MNARRVSPRMWRWLLLVLVPVVPLGVIRERRSWMPRTLHAFTPTKNDSRRIASLAWSPDSKTLAVGVETTMQSVPDEVQLWEATSSRQLRRWRGEGERLTFSPDGALVAGAWASRGYKSSFEVRDTLGVSASRKVLYSVHDAHSGARLWARNLSDRESQTRGASWLAFRGHTLLSLRVEAEPEVSDEELVASNFMPPPRFEAREHEPRTGRTVSTRSFRAVGMADSGAFRPSGAEFALPNDKTIRVISARTGKLRASCPMLSEFESIRAWTHDGSLLAIYDGTQIRLHDLSTGKQRRTLPGGITRAAFSPDNALLATDTGGFGLRLWNLRTGESRAMRLSRPTSTSQPRASSKLTIVGLTAILTDDNNTLAFSPDSSQLAVAGDDGTVTLWRVR